MAFVVTGIITIPEVLADPYGTVVRLVDAGIYGLTGVDVRLAQRRGAVRTVVLWLTLEPWLDTAAHGYPTEQVSITVRSDGYIGAVPLHSDRLWLHRNHTLMAELCLWYPEDPRSLRWEPDDGLAAYVTIVHRHLQAEECWRRHGEWPAEDAPHGPGRHPIRSLATRWAASREG